jgi:hypothetical protein
VFSLALETYHEHIVHLLNMQLGCMPPFAIFDLQEYRHCLRAAKRNGDSNEKIV